MKTLSDHLRDNDIEVLEDDFYMWRPLIRSSTWYITKEIWDILWIEIDDPEELPWNFELKWPNWRITWYKHAEDTYVVYWTIRSGW